MKFTDAEDNLLALGMKHLGKKWELIQQHLLPVKSPKQLQIRCKNLLSNRAPENIIKYYRRNKELWKFPTQIQVSSGKTSDLNFRFLVLFAGEISSHVMRF